MKQLILSSTSPARKKLLEQLQLSFITLSPAVDETPLVRETPEELVKRLAIAKANVHSHAYINSLIIGCDQVIVLDGVIMGKPITHENAVKQLQQSSGCKLTSLTGLCLLNSQTQQCQTVIEPFYVHMRKLTHEMIERYLEKDQPYQCAGSIKAESLGISLFEKLEGSDPTALIGLPLIALTRMLEQEGVNVI